MHPADDSCWHSTCKAFLSQPSCVRAAVHGVWQLADAIGRHVQCRPSHGRECTSSSTLPNLWRGRGRHIFGACRPHLLMLPDMRRATQPDRAALGAAWSIGSARFDLSPRPWCSPTECSRLGGSLPHAFVEEQLLRECAEGEEDHLSALAHCHRPQHLSQKGMWPRSCSGAPPDL